MQEFSLAELSFLIQEGRANDPEVRETLARSFAPELYQFAFAILEGETERAATALALTAETFRTALNEPDEFQSFDTPQTWLFAGALNLAGRLPQKHSFLDKTLKGETWLLLLLRYGFRFTTVHTAEVVGIDFDQAIKRIRRGRSQFGSLKRPRGGMHIADAIDEAIDGLLPWSELDRTEHLKECDACRNYLGELQAVENRISQAFLSTRPAPLSHQALDNLTRAVDPVLAPADPVKSRLSGKETWWIVGAISGFILLSLALNPIWTPPPPTPTPIPTIPPAEELSNQFRAFGYAELERALLFSPAPEWEPGREISGDWIPTTRIVFSSDGEFAAFGSDDIVVLWNLKTNIQTPLGGHTNKVSDVAFSNETWLGTTDRSGVLRIWDIEAETTRYFLSEEKPIRAFTFSRNGAFIAAASRDSITFWQFAPPELIRLNEFAQEDAVLLALSDDGKLLALIDDENAVSIWDLQTFTLQLRIDTGLPRLQNIRFSPAGNRLAAANYDGRIQIIGLSKPLEGNLIGARVMQLDHPAPVLDYTWLDDGRYIAALVSPTEETPAELFTWEMSTGLPATSPYSIARSEAIQTLGITDMGNLLTGTSVGSVSFPVRLQAPDNPAPTEFNQSKTNLFPSDVIFRTAPDPFTQIYDRSMEEVTENISLELPLNEVIPAQYTFTGATYDRQNNIAGFAFAISLSPSREDSLILRIRPRGPGSVLDLQDDWIGARTNFQHVQIGRYLAEFVSGEWTRAAIDNGADGVLRWQESALARFRWTQGNFLYELISKSTVSTEAGRRNRLFQPMAVALISADEDIPMFDYSVKEGDTCLDIAARFGTTVGRLTSLNTLNSDCTIFADQSLTIPVPPPLGVAAQVDLDCNGSEEQVRLIPDPLQPNTEVYFGMVIEALPEGGNEPKAQYATYARFSIADIDVTFFGAPKLLSIAGACGRLIALTGYGGDGEESGLRMFIWTGETLRQVLRTNGFPDAELQEMVTDGYTFTTQRLEYDSTQAACSLIRTAYIWNNNAFTVAGKEMIPGVACFENNVIP